MTEQNVMKEYSESKSLLEELVERRANFEKDLILLKNLYKNLQTHLFGRVGDKTDLLNKINEKNKELIEKKESILKPIRFLRVLIEKHKVKEEISHLEELKADLNENIRNLKFELNGKEKEIQRIKDKIKDNKKEIYF